MRIFRYLMATAAVSVALSGVTALARTSDSAGAAEATESTESIDTAINFCNRHDEKIFVAVAWTEQAGAAGAAGAVSAAKVFARGWWGIDAGACTKLTFPLLDDRVMLFAQSASQVLNWIGDASVCVDLTHAFEFSDATHLACDGTDQGYRAFKAVKVSTLPATDSVATYDFLSQDAVRIGGGLRFCNDTADPVYLSFAQKKSRDPGYKVDGWFSIEASKCHEANRLPSADEVWFYAQGGSGTLAWRGDTPLCTDDVKGYTFDDAGNMPCSGMNQMMQMFRKGTLAVSGSGHDFEYHFSAADAHRVHSMVDICNNRPEKILVATAWKRPEFPDDTVTRGWYVIEPGKCASGLAIDSPVVYLHAETEARVNLLEGEGQVEACIDNSLAFLFSHANSMSCGADNLVNAVFVPRDIAAGKVRVDVNVSR